MLRIAIVTALALAGALVLAAPPGRAPAPAAACSIAPNIFESDVRGAEWIALAEVLAVGPRDISAAPLPPLNTPTASGSANDTGTLTPTPETSPTREGFLNLPPTPSPTSTTQPSVIRDPLVGDLTGLSATLELGPFYAGSAASPFVIDAAWRAEYEQGLREREAGQIRICGPFAPPKYDLGANYLVFFGKSFIGGTGTVMRLRVEGDDVLLAEPGAQPGNVVLTLARTTYNRYLQGVEARFEPESPDYAYITQQRIPLATFARMIAGLRGTIAPPETGSGGLK